MQISASDQDNIGAENLGSTEADPRHVRDINLVFMLQLIFVYREAKNSPIFTHTQHTAKKQFSSYKLV